MNLKKYFGPSTLITAAFIGPGTLTVCTLAGVNAGYSLLWALLFSVFATIVLQEMTARLGLISQNGLGEAIRKELETPWLKWTSIVLILSAIVIGNAAYEAGNISGAMLGMNAMFDETGFEFLGMKIQIWPLIIFAIAFWLLNSGNFKRIERFLIALVGLMSIVFVLTAIIVQPSVSDILSGFIFSQTSSDDLFLAIALIGTTVVPYNLFLHASSVKEKWRDSSELSDLRKENATAIILGGIISVAIVISSAAASEKGMTNVSSVADMAEQLQPLLGSWSTVFLGLGMFAAGISSAITAPLAASYAANGILGWKADMKDKKFKAVWISILLVGTIFSSVGYSPIEIIRFAQIANGILLPVIAVFLIYIMNRKSLLLDFTNSKLQNFFGYVVVIITLFISFRILNSVLNLI